jgi:error-prone DNA polymerase
MGYTELQVTSNFTFLRGASHPEELIEQAACLGYDSIVITDRNTLAGIVRAHAAAKIKGIRFIPGCRLDLLDGPSLLAYPTNLTGWQGLCTLLSTGNLRTEKGKCDLYKADVLSVAADIHFIVMPPETLNASFHFDTSFETALAEYKRVFKDFVSLAATRRYGGDDQKQLYRLRELSKKYDVPLVATNDVHYHNPERRQLQDVLTCIREKCTIYNAGYRLLPNAERYLKR